MENFEINAINHQNIKRGGVLKTYHKRFANIRIFLLFYFSFVERNLTLQEENPSHTHTHTLSGQVARGKKIWIFQVHPH